VIAGAAPPIAPSPPGAGVMGVEAEGAAGADLLISFVVLGVGMTYEAEEVEADSTGAEADEAGALAVSTGSDSVGVDAVDSAGYSSVAEGTTTSDDEAAGAEAEVTATEDEAGAEEATELEAEAEGAGAGAGAGEVPPPE
jgi:hypothetical protein